MLITDPAPGWSSLRSTGGTYADTLVLYHGTTVSDANLILATGVNIQAGNPQADFGLGFYTTTLRRQAESWAKNRAHVQGGRPAVLEYRLPRVGVAQLFSLSFVRGDYDADEFWSFVHHCRQASVPTHYPGKSGWFYDMVSGPVTAFWKQRDAKPDSDQFSFHTQGAAKLLNRHQPRLFSV